MILLYSVYYCYYLIMFVYAFVKPIVCMRLNNKIIIIIIDCQHIHSGVFRYMDASNVSWECLNCGMPTFSTAPFNSTYSIESDNHFSHLQ